MYKKIILISFSQLHSSKAISTFLTDHMSVSGYCIKYVITLVLHDNQFLCSYHILASDLYSDMEGNANL